MIYTMYVLIDDIGRLYKGVINDFERRFSEHKRGKTHTTRKMKNIRLAYKEEFSSFEKAREREIYFKTVAGRRFLKTKLNYLDP